MAFAELSITSNFTFLTGGSHPQEFAHRAIALGLINQMSNLGNLAGPAATAFTVQAIGWSGTPLLFGAVAITGVTLALLLRGVLRKADHSG